MPKQKHINEIAEYLISFEQGTRYHRQEAFHMDCGTAHCLAGWKTLEDYLKHNQVDPSTIDWSEDGYINNDHERDYSSSELEDFIDAILPEGSNDFTEWGYAENAWELNLKESGDLFNAYLTLKNMKENLRKIAETHGLTCPI